MDKKTNIKDIISMAGGLDYINPKDIPSIDLYMDQLTTLHQEQPPPIAQQKEIFQTALDSAHIYLLPEKYAQHK